MYDILIIGSGGAALSAALSAKQNCKKVAILSKTQSTQSQTCMAQGGINAVLKKTDSIENHIKDTLKSGASLSSKQSVTKLCNMAQDTIEWLDNFGVPFNREQDGNIAQRVLGGASHSRACYSQDYTGLKIIHTLNEQIIKEDIEQINDTFLLNIIVENNQAVGVTALDLKKGEVKAYYASSIIIATGGYSMLYKDFSTNHTGSTGDGIAAAYRAGARLRDMEYIQFHPTTLKSNSILISESARGEGGYLVNENNKRFIDELKPRDEVARAIAKEIDAGHEVFLDVRHLGEKLLLEIMPQELKLAKLYEGVDPVSQLIPIKPSAHYTMGGIEVDDNGATSIKGLYACGEVANAKIHGANRLGGNSLLEIIALGRNTGNIASKDISKNSHNITQSKQLDKDKKFINAVFSFTNQIDFYERREFMSKLFFRNVGIIRNKLGLTSVLAQIREYQKEFRFMGVADKSKIYNTNLKEFLEFGNLLELSEMILVSAISRNESRGAHFREDYPLMNDDYASSIQVWMEDDVLCADFENNIEVE